MKYIFLIIFTLLGINSSFSDEKLRIFIDENSKYVIKSSSKTVDIILEKIDDFNEKPVTQFLILWKNKELYYIKKILVRRRTALCTTRLGEPCAILVRMPSAAPCAEALCGALCGRFS